MYDALARIEERLADIELEYLRRTYIATRPEFLNRATAIESIPDFWSTVVDEAPAEIDQRIQPRDVSALNHLNGIDVERFQVRNVDEGEPRSVKLTFTFRPNRWFFDEKIEKTFYWRRSKHGWSGLVSEPVRIRWKDRDLTDGLLDMAVKLWEEEQQLNESSRSRGDVQSTTVFNSLVDKVQRTPQDAISIFAFFGFRGHSVSASESAAATKNKTGMVMGTEQWIEMEKEVPPFPETEIYPHGEEVAVAFSEDLFPGATQYFTAAKERDAKVSEEELVSESETSQDSNGRHCHDDSRPHRRTKVAD